VAQVTPPSGPPPLPSSLAVSAAAPAFRPPSLPAARSPCSSSSLTCPHLVFFFQQRLEVLRRPAQLLLGLW
jgi:hypothetical protein